MDAVWRWAKAEGIPFSKERIRQLIAANRAAQRLTVRQQLLTPERESQLRPLTKLLDSKPKKIVAAWEAAVEIRRNPPPITPH